jgi:hypothetical protein
MTHHAIPAAIGLLVVAALPLASAGSNGPDVPRCARDGVALTGLFTAWVETPRAQASGFCSVRCAEDWLQRRAPESAQVFVADERTGARIDASEAWFVRSTVAASRDTGERVHAFRLRSDADRHAAAFGGRVLDGDLRPFAAMAGTGR